MRPRDLVACAAFLVCLAARADAPVAVIGSGHRLPVTALRYDAASGLLFSAAGDGLVIAWDLATRRPVARLQVSRLPVRMMAVNPAQPHVAVVETDVAVTRLSVWDYRSGRRLFVLELDMPPSSLSYSSTGKYLVASRERYDGLLFLDPTTGERLDLFVGGFGIVSFVTFNSDDAVMMSYQPGGEVRYWDVRPQTQRLRTITTEPFLRLAGVTGTESSPKDSVIGLAGRSLVVADIVRNGAVRDRVAAGDVVSISAGPRGDIATLSRMGGSSVLARWRLDSTVGLLRLSEDRIEPQSWPAGMPTVLTAGPSDLYLGGEDGSIVERNPYGSTRLFSRNELASIGDIAVVGRLLMVALPGFVLEYDLGVVDSGLPPLEGSSGAPDGGPAELGPEMLVPGMFDPDRPSPAGSGRQAPSAGGAPVRVQLVPAPIAGSLRFAVGPGGDAWVWSPAEEPARIARYLPGAAASLGPAVAVDGGLKDVRWAGEELCVVERSGRCSVYRSSPVFPGQMVRVFEYLSPGANVMVATPRSVVIGKSTSAKSESPLLLVNRSTGETVSLPSRDGLVYELAYEPEGDSVLATGVSRELDPWTTLTRFSGPQLQSSTVLAQYHGEDTGAQIVRGASGGAVYSSLGFEIGRIRAAKAEQRQNPASRAPRKLTLGSATVQSLNVDGTITIWDAATLEVLADLFVFRDGEWLGVSREGSSAASPGGAKYLVALPPAAP